MAETGHARNVANFETLVAFCVGYGADYMPTNPLIEIPALQTLLAQAQAALDDVQTKLAPWKNKVADRENIYEGIRPLTTHVLAAFDASGAAENKVDNMKTFQRQVHGARAKALPKDDPGTPEIEASFGQQDSAVGSRIAKNAELSDKFAQMIALKRTRGT